MVGTITDCISNSSENEDISRIQEALFLVKRQLLLIEDSVKSIKWQLNEVQRLENLGETDVPITVPELINKLEVLMSEKSIILKTMMVIIVRLSLILLNSSNRL
jgi:hypothetical protein